MLTSVFSFESRISCGEKPQRHETSKINFRITEREVNDTIPRTVIRILPFFYSWSLYMSSGYSIFCKHGLGKVQNTTARDLSRLSQIWSLGGKKTMKCNRINCATMSQPIRFKNFNGFRSTLSITRSFYSDFVKKSS